ncbi:MAG: hypothetical protein LBD16_04325 [Oscillospiraceae bacterium]|jgi:hypothetical protein|nr:hypothetical protein [Oscillospiraceae bacterium]
MKKAGLFLALLLCVSMFLSTAVAETPYSDLTKWFEEEGNWRTADTGAADGSKASGLLTDAASAPTDEDLKAILHFASLAVTSGGKADWYVVAVKDAAEQKAIIGERAAITSEGTVTLLVLSERLIRPEYRTDEVAPFQPDRGYYDAGIVSGYINIAAVTKGYATRFFQTPALPGTNGFNEGNVGLDVAKYLEGTTYVLASDGETYSTENMKFICAIVIGTPNLELETYSTQHLFPENYSIYGE